MWRSCSDLLVVLIVEMCNSRARFNTVVENFVSMVDSLCMFFNLTVLCSLSGYGCLPLCWARIWRRFLSPSLVSVRWIMDFIWVAFSSVFYHPKLLCHSLTSILWFSKNSLFLRQCGGFSLQILRDFRADAFTSHPSRDFLVNCHTSSCGASWAVHLFFMFLLFGIGAYFVTSILDVFEGLRIIH